MNDYDVDYDNSVVYFRFPMLAGKRNIRITYTAGWDGYAVGLTSYWNFNVTPTGTVDGSNGTFTLPENADELIVYADGVRVSSSHITFTAGTASFTIAAAAVPFSTIAVDYKETLASASGDPVLPAELVDVCERAVVHLFKKRDAEGKASEGFGESNITWQRGWGMDSFTIFDPEMLATIKNYRRGYHL